MTKVVVKPTDSGEFELRTEYGAVLGSRLYTSQPEPDKEYPEIPDKPFRTNLEAQRHAMNWNLYLRYAKKRRKAKRKDNRLDEYT